MIIVELIKNVLKVIYKYAGMALVFAVIFMFVYMSLKERGLKKTAKLWIEEFKSNSEYRKVFVCAFYVAILLGKTLFCREISDWPLSNVLGSWFHDKNGNLITTGIENIILFIPLSIMLLWSLHARFFEKKTFSFARTLKISGIVSALTSVIIEFLQLILKMGSFQLSDMVFNTMGGVIGGVIYFVWCKLRKTK